MLKFLIEKEFKQILRNSFIPRMILIMPIMMILIMPWAANQEIKNIKLCVIDNDHTTVSENLIRKVSSSGYFILTNTANTNEEALKTIEAGEADIILEIPSDFEKDIKNEGISKVMISSNSVNGTKGSLGSSYLSGILNDFSTELYPRYSNQYASIGIEEIPSFTVVPHYKFNPHLDYKVFMVPALMVMLLTMLAGFLPALNIVSEKEAGTIEQINVTPTKRLSFILAKLIPYWVIGLIVLSVCMLLAALVYDITPSGSLLTIYLFTMVYIFVVSGMGLIVSNYSETMQQAMFVMFFFMMILLLMSGLFTPVDSMPEWTKAITVINPLKYFIQVMRLVYLKGSAFAELVSQFFILCGFAVVLNGWAILSYKKNN